MEVIPASKISGELSAKLESSLARLAMAADAGLSTYQLEPEAIKLAKKLKNSVTGYGAENLYKDVKGNEEYYPEQNLPIILFTRYAKLCKDCGDSLKVTECDGMFFAKIADNLFINLQELPAIEPVEFKVKIEGDTIMAVRADLFAKLPAKTQKMLQGEKVEDE